LESQLALYLPSLEYIPIARRHYYSNRQCSSREVDAFSCFDNVKVLLLKFREYKTVTKGFHMS